MAVLAAVADGTNVPADADGAGADAGGAADVGFADLNWSGLEPAAAVGCAEALAVFGDGARTKASFAVACCCCCCCCCG